MNTEEIIKLLQAVKENKVSVEQGAESLKSSSYEDLGYAKIDTDRERRVGYPEIIYCEGKTVEQVKGIVGFMLTKDNNILGTRASKEMFQAVKEICQEAEYNELGRTITVKKKKLEVKDSYIAIVTAGTSDLPVAEEAAATAEILGNKVVKIVDVGVAGIHRLFNKLDIISGAKVVIVVAGMEGALVSVIGGLIDKPIIAVPTSVGYGTNFGGVTTLMAMLNSCASGVSVVNIDNGFGAAYMASKINKL